MTKYEEILDRFLERAGVPWSKYDSVKDFAASLSYESAYEVKTALKEHEDETQAAVMLITGLFLTQIAVDECLESWGLQDPDEDALTTGDRERLARYVLIQNFRNLKNSMLKRSANNEV